jgi:hypothetical protein
MKRNITILIFLILLQSCISIKRDTNSINNSKNEETVNFRLNFNYVFLYYHSKVSFKENNSISIDRGLTATYRALPTPGHYANKKFENNMLIYKRKLHYFKHTWFSTEKIKTYIVVNNHRKLKEKIKSKKASLIVKKHIKSFDTAGKIINNEMVIDTLKTN